MVPPGRRRLRDRARITAGCNQGLKSIGQRIGSSARRVIDKETGRFGIKLSRDEKARMRRNTSWTSTLNVIRLTGKNPPVRGNTEPGILIHPLSGLVLGQRPKRARKTSRCSARNEVPVKNICVDFQHLTQQCRTYSPAFIELLRIERTGLAVLETDALLQRTHHAPSHSSEVTDNAQKSDHGRDNVSGSNAIGRIIHLARFVIVGLDVDEVSTAHAPAMLSIDQTTLNTSAQQSNRTAHRGAHHRDRTRPQRNVSVGDPPITGTEEIVRRERYPQA